MKELQNIIHRHFEDPKQKKRYLALLIALSMLVSFMVPLILMEPADSVTKNKFRASSMAAEVIVPDISGEISGIMLENAAGADGNIGADSYVYSPQQMDLYTLLFGATSDASGNLVPLSWYADCIGADGKLDIDKALDADAAEFFLGFANDFCAFIEGNFESTDADAEGRMFVGGDLTFNKNWNYQVGSGDYGNFKPMNQTEEYQNIYGYASAIVGGKLYRIGTLSTGNSQWVGRNPVTGDETRHQKGTTVFYLPSEGLYKSFVVGNLDDSLHLDGKGSSDIPYTDATACCKHDYPGGDSCPDCETKHSYLENTNELAQLYQYDHVNEILEKTFDLLRMRSSNLGQIKAIDVSPNNGTLVLDASAIGDEETVYFNLVLPNNDTDSHGDWDNSISNIKIIVPDDRVVFDDDGNDYSNGNKTVSELKLNIVVNCGEQEINIDNRETHTFIAPNSERDNQGYRISNHGRDNSGVNLNHTNNHPVSSNILYNFPNAQNVRISGNFNGTILAPNADVTAPEACPGHLSGALIAKSFYGGLEFGYRPYRGGNDILGMTSGYEIPLDKLVAGSTNHLPGAMFAIKDKEGNVISLFESNDGTNFVAIPSDVDFTGNTLYMPDSVESEEAKRENYSNGNPANVTVVKPLVFTVTKNGSAVGSDMTFNVGDSIVITPNQPVTWGDIPWRDGINAQVDNNTGSITININKPYESDGRGGEFKLYPKIPGVDSSQVEVVLNINPVVFNVPDSYVLGESVDLSVSGVSGNATVKYYFDNQQNPVGTGNLENDYSISFKPNTVGNKQIKAEINCNNYNTTLSDNIIGNAPQMSFIVTPTSYVVGQSVTMEVTGAPEGANIKFFLYDNNNWQTKQDGTNTKCTIYPTNTGDNVQVKAEVYYNGNKLGSAMEETISGNLPEMTFNVSPASYTVGESVTMEVTGVPTNYTVKFELYKDGNWQQVQNNANTTCNMTPLVVGDNVQVRASVYKPNDNNTAAWSKTFTLTGNHKPIEIYATPEEYVVGKEIALSVPDYVNNVQYNITGPDGFNSNNRSFTPQAAGEYTINATVQYNVNNTNFTNTITKTITVSEAPVEETPENAAEQIALATFSLRRGINILAAEGDMEKYTINAPEGNTIKNIRLNVDNNNNNHSFKVTFYEGETEAGNTTLSKNDLKNIDNNQFYFDINCPTDKDITKVEIEAVSGYVKINSYDATYLEPCKRVTKTTTIDKLLSTEQELDILVENETWAETMEKLVLNLSNNNNNITVGGTVEYTLFKKKSDGTYEAIGSPKTASSDTDEITLNINNPEVAMVRIKAKTPMDIESCTFSALKDTDFEVTDDALNKKTEAIFESEYTIVEQDAPEGFLLNDEYYKVNVKETIDLVNDVAQNKYPKEVPVVITITKYKKAAEGQEDTVDGTPTVMNFTVGYGQNEDGSIDLSKRIITHAGHDDNPDDVFTLIKNVDTNLITSIKHNDHVLDIDLSKAQVITLPDTEGGHEYYFNPETQIFTPIPAQSMTFTNAPGLLFKKVDDRGAAVTGVTITLTRSDGVEIGNDVWSWDANTSEKLIDVSKLDTNVTYVFTETDSGGKYETADPIYFRKYVVDEVTTIRYGASAEALDDGGNYTELDLVNNREIQMVDERIIGTKLKLKKFSQLTENGNLEILDGAIFSLYAEDGATGTLLKSDIEVTNQEDNPGGIEVDLSGIENRYVENGYLKPGRYYLIETTIPEYEDPDKWYEDPGKISFEVRKAADGTFSVVPIVEEIPGGSGGGTSGDVVLTSGNGSGNDGTDTWDGMWAYWLINNGESLRHQNSNGAIASVEKIYAVLTPWQGNTPNIQQLWTNINPNGQAITTSSSPGFVQSGSNYILDWTLDTPSDLTQFKIFASNIVLAYVKITAKDASGNSVEYVFQDGSYTPASAASIADEPAVVDENDDAAENNVLEIINKLDDNKRDVIVKKTWSGDDGFEAVRPDVTFTLYQSETEITDRTLLTPASGYLYHRRDAEGNITTDPYTITITEPNSDGEWFGKFEDLPTRYKDEATNEYRDYYYYIVETPVDGYTCTGYETLDGGILKAENTLVPVTAKAEKIWAESNGIALPPSVTLQLQVKDDEDNWVDVEGKTVTLTAEHQTTPGKWSSEITGLLPNRTYRFTDNVNFWEVDESNGVVVNNDATPETISITNKPKPVQTGALEISKIWGQHADNLLPGSIFVQLFRKVEHIWPEQTQEEVMEDYARLLQYSLYFYDANMCGVEVDEKSAISWRDECHDEDVVDGGFHDAGDHVMFGLPQGYAASMLGWGLYEFNTTVEDESKKVYDNLGQTEHMKVLTEYFCDFFVNSIRDNNGTTEILVQKGEGQNDHDYWGPPEDQQPERTNEMYWTNNSGSDIAAEYAASLALAYLNFYDENAEDADKYQNYLEVAKQYFDYAIEKDSAYNVQGVNIHRDGENKGFYKSGSHNDDIAWAAAWLALATGQDTYKQHCNSIRNGKLGWDDVTLAAACANAHVTGDWSALANDPANVRRGTPSSYLKLDEWGSARYNAMAQMVSLVVAKNLGNTSAENNEYATWAEWQMNYLLGNNPYNTCFVTGFAENSAENAHHRGASGYEAGEYNNKGGTAYELAYDEENGKTLIGALVGGPNDAGYQDIMDSQMAWQTNEVTLDYNAGLVGAAAGLYYFFGTGEPYAIPGVKIQYLPDETQAAAQAEPQLEPQADAQAYNAPESAQNVPNVQNASSVQNTPSVQNAPSMQNAAAQQSITTQPVVTTQQSITTQPVTTQQNIPITPASESGAKVAKLSSKFSNAFSILSSGVSRFATETVEMMYPAYTTFGELVKDKEVTFEVPYQNVIRVEIDFTAQPAPYNSPGMRFGVVFNKDVVEAGGSGNSGTVTISPTDWSGNTVSAIKVKDAWGMDSGTITQIRFYYQGTQNPDNPTPSYNVTGASSMTVNATESFTVSGMSGNITWTYKLNGGSANKISGQTGTTCSFTPTEAGSYEIIATDANGNSASTTVTVNAAQQEETFTVTIDKNLIKVGDSATLTPSPADNVQYQQNIDGLSFNGNTVTASKAGTYNITLTRNGKSEQVTLNVIGLNKSSASVDKNNTVNWSIDGLPNGATVTWESYNTGVATVNNGTITGVSAGTATIKATVNYNGKTVTFEDSITVNDNSSGGSTGGVTTPDGYVLIDTVNVNKPLYKYADIPSNEIIVNGYDGVSYIIVEFESSNNFNGVIYYNSNYDSNVGYEFGNGGTHQHPISFNSPVDLNTVHIRSYWNDATVKNVYFYRLKADPTIVEITDEIRVGDAPIQLVATDFDGPVTWSITNGAERATIDETTGLFTPISEGTVTVQAKYGNQVDTIDITIKPFQLTFESGNTSEEFRVHVGKEVEIAFNTQETVTINLPINDFVTQSGGYKFHGNQATDGQSFTATLNGTEVHGTIIVVAPMEISSSAITNNLVYTNRNYQLNASNNIGNVEWSITSGEDIAEIDPNTGVLTPKGSGTIKVTAQDMYDNTIAEYTVEAKVGSATVDTTGLEQVTGLNDIMNANGIIEITADDNWKKTISNLPVVDANGDYYSYYIVECDAQGRPIQNENPIKASDGTMYLPLSYTNGTMLESGDTSEVSVENAMSGKAQGQMPSSGGVGRTTYYYFGGFIAILSTAGIISHRRRQRSRR